MVKVAMMKNKNMPIALVFENTRELRLFLLDNITDENDRDILLSRWKFPSFPYDKRIKLRKEMCNILMKYADEHIYNHDNATTSIAMDWIE